MLEIGGKQLQALTVSQLISARECVHVPELRNYYFRAFITYVGLYCAN